MKLSLLATRLLVFHAALPVTAWSTCLRQLRQRGRRCRHWYQRQSVCLSLEGTSLFNAAKVRFVRVADVFQARSFLPSFLPWSSFLSIFISPPRKFIRFEFVEDLDWSNHVGRHSPFNLGFQIYLQLLNLSLVCSILHWPRWYWIWRQIWDPRLNGHGLGIVYILSLSLSSSLFRKMSCSFEGPIIKWDT